MAGGIDLGVASKPDGGKFPGIDWEHQSRHAASCVGSHHDHRRDLCEGHHVDGHDSEKRDDDCDWETRVCCCLGWFVNSSDLADEVGCARVAAKNATMSASPFCCYQYHECLSHLLMSHGRALFCSTTRDDHDRALVMEPALTTSHGCLL